MENHNDIDKLFSDESAKDEADTKFPAFEKVWNEVEHRLDRKDNRGKIFRIWLPYAIAASFAIIFGSLYFFNFMKNNSEKPQIVENVASKKTEIAKENPRNLAEISSNSKIENVEDLNQKIQENIKKNPLKTKEIIAYQNPKTENWNQIFLEKPVGLSKVLCVEPSVQQSPVSKANITEILPEKSDSFAKEKDINEVVVTGFGTKKMKTGDYAKVSAEQMKMKISDSAQNSENFAMNDDYDEVKISMAKGSEPLYIVDGYIADNNFLKSFDVKKIYSLNIVEGNSAVKFYGKNGKKGVVLITTKGLSAKEERKLQEISKNFEFKVN